MNPLFNRVDKASFHDAKIMDDIIDKNKIDLTSSYHNPKYIVADKGYTSAQITKKLKAKNIIYTVPQKKNKKNRKKEKNKRKECLKNRFQQ